MGFKPSREEQKWATQQEVDIRRKLREFRVRRRIDEAIELDSTCPVDEKPLEKTEIDKTGIFVYKCPVCGGIWISRKDVEKLLHSTGKSSKFVKYLASIFNIKI